MTCRCDIKKLLSDGHEAWCLEHPDNKKLKKQLEEPDEVKWFDDITPPPGPRSTPKMLPGIDWSSFI